MIRQFINLPLTDSLIITKDDNCFHHLNNVLRIKVHKQVAFVNNKCTIYELVEKQSDKLYFEKIEDEATNPEINKELTLFTPFLKKDNFELVLQKATEIGVTKFIAGTTTNSVVKVDEQSFNKKLKRYNDIIESAAMQSQRNIIPQLFGVYKLKQLDLQSYDLIICCYESRQEQTMFKLKDKINYAQKILIIVGPEGGFTSEEISYLQEHNTNIVTLGNTILRAETACITSVFLLTQIIKESNEDICN